MPAGLVLDGTHWAALADALDRRDARLIYDAAMGRIRFDGRPPDRPARTPGPAERTITVGSASTELRLIGRRVGWVAGPAAILHDARLVGLTNVVCQVGIAQRAVADALAAPDADADVAAATAIWRERREAILRRPVRSAGRPAGRRLVAAGRLLAARPVPPDLSRRLSNLPVVRPDGGWSLLVDCGLPPPTCRGGRSTARRSRRRRWTTGGRPGRTTCGSSSPTNRSNGSATWPNGSAGRPSPARCGSGWRRP